MRFNNGLSQIQLSLKDKHGNVVDQPANGSKEGEISTVDISKPISFITVHYESNGNIKGLTITNTDQTKLYVGEIETMLHHTLVIQGHIIVISGNADEKNINRLSFAYYLTEDN